MILKDKKFQRAEKFWAVLRLCLQYIFTRAYVIANANLKLLSGFPPPLSYSVYGEANVKHKGVEPAVINDFSKAVALSKKEQKPILIDFTGWACVNCRKMEEHVWTKPEISSLLSEKFILVSLYVDDRKNYLLQTGLFIRLKMASKKR